MFVFLAEIIAGVAAGYLAERSIKNSMSIATFFFIAFSIQIVIHFLLIFLSGNITIKNVFLAMAISGGISGILTVILFVYFKRKRKKSTMMKKKDS